jgi:phosphoribosylanthranilate isomerase
LEIIGPPTRIISKGGAMPEPVRVKICGITRVQDALAAADAGADAIGLNFYSGSARCVTPDAARKIASAVSSRLRRYNTDETGRVEVWGVFVDEDPARIRGLARDIPLARVQLHGRETPEAAAALADLSAVKALRVKDAQSIAEAGRYSGLWGMLLDAFSADAAGGTGSRFDWSWIPLPWKNGKLVLAGGLDPDNVAEAVRAVQPDWVDTASGVERRPGEKDPERVRTFVENAKRSWGKHRA